MHVLLSFTAYMYNIIKANKFQCTLGASQPINDTTNTGSPPVMELPAGHLPVPPHDVTVPLVSGIRHNWKVFTETKDDNNIEGLYMRF